MSAFYCFCTSLLDSFPDHRVRKDRETSPTSAINLPRKTTPWIHSLVTNGAIGSWMDPTELSWQTRCAGPCFYPLKHVSTTSSCSEVARNEWMTLVDGWVKLSGGIFRSDCNIPVSWKMDQFIDTFMNSRIGVHHFSTLQPYYKHFYIFTVHKFSEIFKRFYLYALCIDCTIIGPFVFTWKTLFHFFPFLPPTF